MARELLEARGHAPSRGRLRCSLDGDGTVVITASSSMLALGRRGATISACVCQPAPVTQLGEGRAPTGPSLAAT